MTPTGAMRQSSVEQVSDREMEYKEKQSSSCTMKRGRTRDVRAMSGSVLMSVTHVTTQGYGDIPGLGFPPGALSQGYAKLIPPITSYSTWESCPYLLP